MSKTALQIASSKQYMGKVCETLRQFMGPTRTLIYVTTNKPYSHVESLLKKEDVKAKGFFFIDCISETTGSLPAEEPGNCMFIDSPQQVTGLSLAIDQAGKLLPGEKVVLLDSLSTLLIYNNEDTIGKFSNFMINRLRYMNISAILIVLDSDSNTKVVKTIESFVDEVIER